MAAVLEIKGRIRLKSRSWRKHDLTTAEMCLSIDMSDWKTTPRFFAELVGEIILESILMLQFGLLRFLGLTRRYSVLFGLTDNLLATIQENISLIHDSINEKTVVTSGEKDKYIWVSSA